MEDQYNNNIKISNVLQNNTYLHNSLIIYNDSFPEWEKEDNESIINNIQNGIYEMYCYIDNNEVQGFYLLEKILKQNYILFSYLAVKESLRGNKIGTKLCIHAINNFKKSTNFNFLIIEAENRQAKLYQKIGFKKILIDYYVPQFNSMNSEKMNLLYIQKQEKLNSLKLKIIIKNIFNYGYSLKKDDPRIKQQLDLIPGKLLFDY